MGGKVGYPLAFTDYKSDTIYNSLFENNAFQIPVNTSLLIFLRVKDA